MGTTDRSAVANKRELAVRGLTALALALLGLVFYSPVWWVSLKAPQYPAEAFPDGVRINFHMNGVFNGCELLARHEIAEEKALDCVHEMDAINHFVGMFPIASGGVVEKFYAPFLLSLVAVMIVGFAIRSPRLRVAVMGLSFAGIAAWMALAFFTTDGIRFQSATYLDALVVSLGQGEAEEGGEESPIIAALKRSLVESGASASASSEELAKSLGASGQEKLGEIIGRLHEGTKSGDGREPRSLKEILAAASSSRLTGKALSIEILRQAYEMDQGRKPAAERVPWTGSGAQLVAWHHEKSLGRWFNAPETNGPIARRMAVVAEALFWVLLAGMAALLVIARTNGPWLRLLIVIPILLPVFFVVEYAAWLWWYGHTLNEMGAFTLKPFMPTVFGQGKVAQFTTHSYPHRGFLILLLISAVLTLALLIRRKADQEASRAGIQA
jgi:hypothetical protein